MLKTFWVAEVCWMFESQIRKKWIINYTEIFLLNTGLS
jgi:hypothetical protein